MRGNKSVIGIGAVLGRCTWKNTTIASVSSSSHRLYETLISPPTRNKTSSPAAAAASHCLCCGSASPAAKSHFSALARPPLPLLSLRRYLSAAPSGSSSIVLVNSEQEFETSLKDAQDKSLPAVFYFTAVWCGPCKFISPIIEELSGKYPHVTIYKVDIDKEGLQSTLSKLHVSAVPTLQFYQNGKKTASVVGADVTKLKDTMEALYG